MERSAGTPLEIAVRLRRAVRERVGLPVTVGIARTKFLAKVASAAAKPDGLLLVPPDGERAFLHPLPVERMWGVGHATATQLRSRGIATVGDLARVPEGALAGDARRGGRPATCTRSRTTATRGAWSCGRGAARSARSTRAAAGGGRRQRLDADLVAIVDRVMRRVRAAHRVGRTVVLRLRFDDFSRATRSRTLFAPTARTSVVLAAARDLFAEARPLIDRRGLTLIGISLANLADDLPFQLELPFDPDGVAARWGAGRDPRPLRQERRHARRSARPLGALDAPAAGLTVRGTVNRTRRRPAAGSLGGVYVAGRDEFRLG